MIDVVAQYTLVGAASVIGFLITILVGILSWIFNRSLQDTTAELRALRESDSKLAAEVSALRAELPEKYVGKVESSEFRREVRDSIESLSKMMMEGFKEVRSDINEGRSDRRRT